MTFPVLGGKATIVTGAAMGMGEATARLFAEAGAKVLVADMNEERGRAVAEEITADGGTAVFHRVNVADSAQVKEMVQVAVDHFGRLDAAVENGPHNIRVNAVAPGAIDTPMLRGALDQFGFTEEEYAPQLSLLNRFGQPREVAQASLWLASDQSSYVTGSVLHVDAGYTSR